MRLRVDVYGVSGDAGKESLIGQARLKINARGKIVRQTFRAFPTK